MRRGELREAGLASREKPGAGLTERAWMIRVLDETYSRINELARVQRYPFPVDDNGQLIKDDLPGPEYVRRQRLRLQRLGVRILGHTPALPLLPDDSGAVLSGMEFSNAYAIAPKGTGVTKHAFYNWATLVTEGTIRGAGGVRIAGNGCATDVPGLYAAFAHRRGASVGPHERRRQARHRGLPRRGDRSAAPGVAVRDHYLRHADRLTPALGALDELWSATGTGRGVTGEERFRAREAAAMLAHSGWRYHAALTPHRKPRHAPVLRSPRARSAPAAPPAHRRARRTVDPP